MKLYTKAGDDGYTGLLGGQRVAKESLRVTTYGDVDETNAVIGVAMAACANAQPVVGVLQSIQRDLFCIGADLASPGGDSGIEPIGESQIRCLENWIDQFHDPLPPMKSFVLPGGTAAAAHLHYARTVCRRAERNVAGLAQQETIAPSILVYLNRLSDLLFALARHANHLSGMDDVPWVAPRKTS